MASHDGLSKRKWVVAYKYFNSYCIAAKLCIETLIKCMYSRDCILKSH